MPLDHPFKSDCGGAALARSSLRRSKDSRREECTIPTKLGTRTKRSASFKSLLGKDVAKSPKKRSDKQEGKTLKKSKSSTSLSALLSRPKLSKDPTPNEEESQKDKENWTPPSTANYGPPPIWAQFATQSDTYISSTTKVPLNDCRNREEEKALCTPQDHCLSKQRSFTDSQESGPPETIGTIPWKPEGQSTALSSISLAENFPGLRRSTRGKTQPGAPHEEPMIDLKGRTRRKVERQPGQETTQTRREDGDPTEKRGSRVMAAVAAFNGKSKGLPKEPTDDTQYRSATLDPKAVEAAFETLLETRNVPQATRDKMRTLDTNIKTDFIKQDKASSGSTSSTDNLMSQNNRPLAGKRSKTDDGALESAENYESTGGSASPKKSRPRSLTFTFSRGDQSPSKRQKSRAHGRTQSGELTPPESSKHGSRPTSGHGTSLFNKVDKFALPEQVILYLRKVQAPQSIEIGKIQKLRQLLRNETVGWIEAFVAQGGMSELVELLYRIMTVEWREEHEDTLLHESLLCLKALSTTSSAMAQISVIQATLFPALVQMIFDNERKGPSEYNTRTIVFNVLFNYLATATSGTFSDRARILLSYLHDPTKPKEAQAPEFITSIYHSRPYRTWNNELNNLTKEVFWIFLHHVNIIPYPPAPKVPTQSYRERHFPREHPPVPAAPYIGGVEWDVTAYLTTHLDLINGLIASLPTCRERNQLRQEMKDSGFEKLMGASFRTCKEKFYGSVHEALSIWIGAAREDGWPEKDVRQGPPREEVMRSPVKRGKKKEEAPKLAMPKLDLGEGTMGGGDGGWL